MSMPINIFFITLHLKDYGGYDLKLLWTKILNRLAACIFLSGLCSLAGEGRINHQFYCAANLELKKHPQNKEN